MSSLDPVVLSLEVGSFPYETRTEAAAAYWSSRTRVDQGWVKNLYQVSGMERRFLAIPDFQHGAQGTEGGVLDKVAHPKIQERMQRAVELATPLVVETARRALESSGLQSFAIGQLLIVSSTVLASPGLELALMKELRLHNGVTCTHLNYGGCAMGIDGLRQAMQFCQVHARNGNPAATLMVCVEISSIHASVMGLSDKAEHVEHMLFGDGVACAVIGLESAGRRPDTLVVLRDYGSLKSSLENGIVLSIEDQGVHCRLSPELPKCVEESTRALQREMTEGKYRFNFHVIHPGGKKIIDAVLAGLDRHEIKARFAREIFKDHGNTISCGVLYVMRRMMIADAIPRGCYGLALAFGPGVFAKAILLETR